MLQVISHIPQYFSIHPEPACPTLVTLVQGCTRPLQLECAERLGDTICLHDMTPALPVYWCASALKKVVACFAETGQFEKIVLYSKKADLQPDYTTLLQRVMRTRPEKGAEFIMAPAAVYKETSTEKAAETTGAPRDAGIKRVVFKAGSVEGIRQAVVTAATNADYPITMQWIGSRVGVHHLYKDFHQPILATYASIQSQPNISLVAGSGFGDGEGAWPYTTGERAVEYGAQPMHFEGALFGSRAMTAKEAHTSDSINDDKWEQTHKGETGGALTAQSELGGSIHKTATHTIKLWKEFDETVLKLTRDGRRVWLNANADSVVKKLNRDFAKPWFVQKKDDTVAKDLGDLTHEEKALRPVSLMYVKHRSCWIDILLRSPLGDWLRRVEDYIVKKLLEGYYNNDESKAPYTDYIGSVPDKINPTLAISYGFDIKLDQSASSLPPVDERLKTLVGPEVTFTWLRLASSFLFGEHCVKDWIHREASQMSLSLLQSNAAGTPYCLVLCILLEFTYRPSKPLP